MWRRLAQLVSLAQGQVLAAVATWTLVRGTGLPHPAPSPPETYSGETISEADGPPHMLWARCERTRRAASPCPMGLCSKWISRDQEKKSRYSPRPRPPLREALSLSDHTLRSPGLATSLGPQHPDMGLLGEKDSHRQECPPRTSTSRCLALTRPRPSRKELQENGV